MDYQRSPSQQLVVNAIAIEFKSASFESLSRLQLRAMFQLDGTFSQTLTFGVLLSGSFAGAVCSVSVSAAPRNSGAGYKRTPDSQWSNECSKTQPINKSSSVTTGYVVESVQNEASGS